LIAFALIITPYLSPISEVSHYRINIDGDFSDWTGLTTQVEPRDELNPSIDIVNIGLENNDDYLSFFIETEGTILAGGNDIVDTFMVFIDYDLDYDTGYRIDQLGADYMFMVYGEGGEVLDSILHEFDNHESHEDWNGWSVSGFFVAATSINRLEAQVSWDMLGTGEKQVDALFYSQDYALGEDFADHVVSNVGGVLLVETRSAGSDVLTGGDNRILEIELKALESDIEVTELNISLIGTTYVFEIGNLKLVDRITGDTIKQVAPSSKNATFTLDAPVRIDEGSTLEWLVLVDVIGASGHTVGARIENSRDVQVEAGTASLKELSSDRGLGYIGFVPQNFTIDGGFSDWTTPVNDTDVLSIANPDIDIHDYDLAVEDDSFYFYLSVEGEMLKGTEVPFRNRIKDEQTTGVPPDSDRDTVPDEVDPLPNNFDNQGRDDEQTDNDVDEDQIKDYPYGDDWWLNTTIPLSFPTTYAGKPVSIFIGPVIMPPMTGEDTLRIYIDENPSILEGYTVDGLFADYMIQVTGKNWNVINSELFEFPSGASPGNGNAWTLLGSVQCMKDLSGIEGLAELGVPLNVSIAEALIEMVDTKKELDKAGLVLADATKGIGSVGVKSSKKIIPMFAGDADHRFLVTGYSSHRINEDDDWISMKFTAKTTLTPAQTHFYLSGYGTAGGQNADFQVALYSNSGGNPGSSLCSGSFTNNGALSVGWISTNPTSCPSLSQGTIYHLVIHCTSQNNRCGDRFIDVRYTAPNNNKYPVDGTSDANMDVLTIENGGSWTSLDYQPLFVICDNTGCSGTNYGNPYHIYQIILDITSSTGHGNIFQISSNRAFDQAEFYLARTSGSTSGNLVLKIRNLSDSVNVLTDTRPGTNWPVALSPAWYTWTFPSPVSLVSGKSYAIWLETDNVNLDFGTYANIAENSAPYNALTFDGTTTFRTQVTVSSLTFANTTNHDIPFTLVPEFSETLIPISFSIIIPVAIFWNMRKKKRK
jgi:hypothetical protein